MFHQVLWEQLQQADLAYKRLLIKGWRCGMVVHLAHAKLMAVGDAQFIGLDQITK